MGADMLLASLPDAEITEERKRRLQEIVNGPTGDELIGQDLQVAPDDPQGIRETLHHHVELFAEATSRRDVARLRLPHMPYGMLFTGGMSWGDDPTELFDTFDVLAGIEPVFAQLEQWAREDGGTSSPALDGEGSALAVLKEFAGDVRAAFGTGQGDVIDEDGLNWPDLAATYHKAVDVLNRRIRGASAPEESA
jgi:hypothetical protein